MARRFRGESVHKVDNKGRVSIPASFRRVLEEGDPDWKAGTQPQLILVYGRHGKRCLEGFSVRHMDELDEKIEMLPDYSPEREALARMLNTKSVQTQVDENGRIVLSARLRETIGVTDEAIFAGMGNRFQIWNPDEYAADNLQVLSWIDERGGADGTLALLSRQQPKG